MIKKMDAWRIQDTVSVGKKNQQHQSRGAARDVASALSRGWDRGGGNSGGGFNRGWRRIRGEDEGIHQSEDAITAVAEVSLRLPQHLQDSPCVFGV